VSRIRILIAFCAAIAMLSALATVSSAADTKLYSKMNGTQEKPKGDPDGVGTAVLTLKSNKICYDIRAQKAGTTFAAGHIHVGKAGTAGDVVVPLFQSPKKLAGGKLVGCSGTVKASVMSKIKASPSGYYVNIHNAKFAPGAIRGQLSKTKPA